MKLALVKEPMYRLAPAIEHGERRINGSVVRKQPFDRQMWLERHSRKRQEDLTLERCSWALLG